MMHLVTIYPDKPRVSERGEFQMPMIHIIKLILLLLLVHPLSAEAGLSRETPVVRAVRKVRPAVVNIGSEYEVRYRSNPFSGFSRNPLFDEFFKDFFDRRFERSQKRTSLGSGVIIDGKRGFILTNAHVIAKSGVIKITLNDEREFTAVVVGADPDSDLAVLRISPETPLPSIAMGSSNDLMIGETVIAIGNPFGFSHTVTTGVISATERSIRTDDRVYHNFIQIDASINPGNSGGPLLNIDGELIGINTAIYAKAQGIGFAIPIGRARKIVSDLIKYGEVVPAWIGIAVQDLNPEVTRYLNFPENRGIIVQGIHRSGPAGKSGLQNGDIILSIDNQSLTSVEDYRSVMKKYTEGNVLKVNLWRNGKIDTIEVVAAVFPTALAEDLAFRLFGIRVQDFRALGVNSRESAESQGVVITEIQRDSYLGQIGVERGDVIRRIDDISIRNLEDFKKTVVKYRQKSSLVILLFRGNQGYYITVKL